MGICDMHSDLTAKIVDNKEKIVCISESKLNNNTI